jgi:hypothetical protein
MDDAADFVARQTRSLVAASVCKPVLTAGAMVVPAAVAIAGRVLRARRRVVSH